MSMKDKDYVDMPRENVPPGVQQSSKQDCDINFIVSRYRATGQVSPSLLNATRKAIYSEVDNKNLSFHQILCTAREAQAEFNRLPARVRQMCEHKLDNLPGVLADESLRDELVKLGVFQGPKDELIQKVMVISAPEAAPVVVDDLPVKDKG